MSISQGKRRESKRQAYRIVSAKGKGWAGSRLATPEPSFGIAGRLAESQATKTMASHRPHMKERDSSAAQRHRLKLAEERGQKGDRVGRLFVNANHSEAPSLSEKASTLCRCQRHWSPNNNIHLTQGYHSQVNMNRSFAILL